MLEHVKRELLLNPRLAKDFPEVVYPLRRLEDNARRCKGQLWGDVQTLVDWGPTRITFPTIPKSKVSGSTLTVSGLTGSLRGQSHVLASGRDHQTSNSFWPTIHSTREIALFQDSNRAAARDNQRRFVGYGGTGPDGFLRHALHGDRTRRPGRPTLEPRQEPAMARRAHADGVRFPDRRKVVGAIPAVAGRQFPRRRRRPARPPILQGAPRRDGRRRHSRLGPSDSTKTRFQRSNTP